MTRHFGRDQHTRDDLKVQILELICMDHIGPHTDDFREIREHSWIHHLRTLQPLGLNAIDEKKHKQRQTKQVANPQASTSNHLGALESHFSQ